MANIKQLAKPPRMPEPPKPTSTVSNLEKPTNGEKVPIQFRIAPEMRRDFKGHAVAHDMDANALFETVWNYYKEHHG